VAEILARHEQSRPEQARRYADGSREEHAASQPTAADRPTVPIVASLQDYICLALAENPDLKAARQTALARAKRIPQVTALPDPMIATRTYSPNRPMMLAEGNNVFSMAITQQLPNPEKLDRQGRIALEETRMALAELEQTRLRVIGDVKRAYFQLYNLDQSIRITGENRRLLMDLVAVVRIQVSANKRPQDDALRAQVEVANLDRDLIELRQNRITTAAMLNTLLGRPPQTTVPRPEVFNPRDMDLKIESLMAQAIETNPELKRLEHQIERDRQSRRLAGLGYWPEFRIGVEWMAMEPRQMPAERSTQTLTMQPNGQMMPMTMMPMGAPKTESPEDMYAIMAEMSLPVWVQKIDAGIKEAEYNLGASIDQYTAARNRVAFRIQDALARVQAQRQLVEILKNTILPQARQAYELSRTSYAAGTTEFLAVSDNRQKWLTFNIQYHRALAELQRSMADLEQEIGRSLCETRTAK
jgi:outer membrane protein, heavy metal efflux system